MKITLGFFALFLTGCSTSSYITVPSETQLYLTDKMRTQMASQTLSSLEKHVGKYEYPPIRDAKGKLIFAPDNLGLELRPDGTYFRDMGKPYWEGTYSLQGNIIILNGYFAKRTARGKFNKNTLTIYDKGEGGKVTFIKTWPKADGK